MVQSVKRILFKNITYNLHDYETFRVVTKEIAGIINDRPIAYLDQETIDPIIPSKLISGRVLSRPEISDLPDNEDEIPLIPESTPSKLIALEIHRRNSLREWWTEFQNEYFDQLTKFQHETKTVKPIELGQIVLVHEEKVKRIHWRIARVTKLYAGDDGIVRQVDITLPNRVVLNRPIQRLYPLEAHAGQIDSDPTTIGTPGIPAIIPQETSEEDVDILI
jgi:hypothetical protein